MPEHHLSGKYIGVHLVSSLFDAFLFHSNQMSSFSTHKNIAYRFMSPSRLTRAIDVTVTCSPCVWTRIFFMCATRFYYLLFIHIFSRYRGVTDDELSAFAGAGEKEASAYDWKNMIGWMEQSRDKQAFRLLETSVLEIN